LKQNSYSHQIQIHNRESFTFADRDFYKEFRNCGANAKPLPRIANLQQIENKPNPDFLKAPLRGAFKKIQWWVCSGFAVVTYYGVTQIVNLSPPRSHILNFFSPACQRYYLLPVTVS